MSVLLGLLYGILAGLTVATVAVVGGSVNSRWRVMWAFGLGAVALIFVIGLGSLGQAVADRFDLEAGRATAVNSAIVGAIVSALLVVLLRLLRRDGNSVRITQVDLRFADVDIGEILSGLVGAGIFSLLGYGSVILLLPRHGPIWAAVLVFMSCFILFTIGFIVGARLWLRSQRGSPRSR